MQPIDTVEQTIEKLMTTIEHLHNLADRAINNVTGPIAQDTMRKEFNEIMEKHHNQY